MQSAMLPIELFDWIINEKCLRGSTKNDNGCWLSNSETPKYFCEKSRIVELNDGRTYLIQKNTICKALGLDKKSENVLSNLPNPT